MSDLDFFKTHYSNLRPGYKPMKWMNRMFRRLINGKQPSVTDLPTGAGKTELIVIWLIALAWYSKHRDTAKPLPRRLVWVVNRRVLVQQVFVIAEKLQQSLKSPTGSIIELAADLRTLCRSDSPDVFNVVQLRGQRLDDREWALHPTMPQLIIGTVDQIGSRLLFQGYGQGKWARPMHASLLGVDAWVCVDEAHLVPAFAVTLRQVREMTSRQPDAAVPRVVSQFFEKLPFWITELSATPGLPPPHYGEVFALDHEDASDEVIADRLTARDTRRVLWKSQPEKKQIARDMATKALAIAESQSSGAIAVFTSTAKDAETIAKELKKKYPNRVLSVTGRIRGYERDRLEKSGLFKRFRENHPEVPAVDAQPTFLVGTAAAEVGLDADASAIVCDFASLPTLVQRLGRLDRRGQLGKRALKDETEPPTMTIIGGNSGKTTPAQLNALLTNLNTTSESEGPEFRAEFFTGAPWAVVVGKEKAVAEDDDAPEETTESTQTEAQEEDKKATGEAYGKDDAVNAATWSILSLPTASPDAFYEARQPAAWLADPIAAITSGPVVVPPLTESVMRRWAATTPPPSRFLPVHPWLYGLLPDEEGTPLVGIAFRLELDILRFHGTDAEEDEDGAAYDREWQKVRRCLTEFPPLNSEMHFVPLHEARAWLETLSPEEPGALAHFDGDEWTDAIASEELSTNSVLVLPTSTNPKLIESIISPGGDDKADQPCWDVFEALAQDGAKYRREIKITAGASHLNASSPENPGVYRVSESDDTTEVAETAVDALLSTELNPAQWKRSGIKLSFSSQGITFELRYFKPSFSSDTALDLLPNHLNAAEERGKQLAEALAPGEAAIALLLGHTGQQHDIGKGHPKWQQGMGNTPAWRGREGHDDTVLIAKPVIENPGKAGGYRHEWGTLWAIQKNAMPIAEGVDTNIAAFLRELHLHTIAAHHGFFRPSMPDRGLSDKPTAAKQNQLRLDSIERAARLQRQLGCWRLAYLETLIKVADVSASRDAENPDTEDATNES